MSIQKLREKNRHNIINHATRIFGIDKTSDQLRKATETYLLDGKLHNFILAIKNQNITEKNTGAACFLGKKTIGTIRPLEKIYFFPQTEIASIEIELENQSNETWKTDKHTPIFLSYHWHMENGEICDWDGIRTPLQNQVNPGEKNQMLINIKPYCKIGSYTLEITMVMEGEFWFEHQGLITHSVKVEIIPSANLSPRVQYIYSALLKTIKNKQGAIKNQVQHPDRVWCCDGKTLRTIEA